MCNRRADFPAATCSMTRPFFYSGAVSTLRVLSSKVGDFATRVTLRLRRWDDVAGEFCGNKVGLMLTWAAPLHHAVRIPGAAGRSAGCVTMARAIAVFLVFAAVVALFTPHVTATTPKLAPGKRLADPVTTVQGLIGRVLGTDMVRAVALCR